MKDKSWYPIVYMFVVTAVFSGVLVGFSDATSEQVKRNEQIFRERAVLAAAGLIDDDAPAEEVHRVFTERVKVVKADEAGGDDETNIVEYVINDEAGAKPTAYAIPVHGRGYWDMIRGALAVKDDRKTVIGIAFYEQKETPGLGAEIAERPFRDQFDGKTLADGATALKFRPAGSTVDASAVHAITGATQTCTRLERFLNRNIATWRERAGDGAGDAGTGGEGGQ